MPIELQKDFKDWIFGCDICQDVCPWNRFSKPHQEPLFETNSQFLGLNRQDWEGLSEDLFNELFRYSAINRTKLKGIKRNIAHIKKMEP